MRRVAADALVAFLFSLVVSYMVWAVSWERWVFCSRQPGGNGSATMMYVDPLTTYDAAALTSADLAMRLTSIASREGVAIYTTNVAVGRPEISIIDPAGILEWMPAHASGRTAYPFQGSSLNELFRDGAATGLLPAGYRWGAAIKKPSLARYSQAQYACLWDADLPISLGEYTITSTDPTVAQEVAAAFEESLPVTASTTSRATFLVFALHEPPFVLGLLMLFGSVATVVLYEAARLETRTDVYRLSWCCGASALLLLRRDVTRAAILALALTCGAALCVSAVPVAVSLSPVPVNPYGTFFCGWAFSWAVTTLLRTICACVFFMRSTGRWQRA